MALRRLTKDKARGIALKIAKLRELLAALAIQPKPRCCAVQVAERGGRAWCLHGADWTPAGCAESSR
jgi:hypothetical protein